MGWRRGNGTRYRSQLGLTVIGVMIAALAFTPSTARAQLEASIDGEVTDARSGEPLTGVRVRLAGTNLRALTDSRGRFQLSGLAPGSYQLWVLGDGYLPVMQKVDIAAGQTFHTRTELEPQARASIRRAPTRTRTVLAEHITITASGGIGFMTMTDYNMHVSTAEKLATSPLSRENRTWEGTTFHRGNHFELELRHPLTSTLAVGLGSGRIWGSKGNISSIKTDVFRYTTTSDFSVSAVPVDLIAYAIYPQGKHAFYLGWGFSWVFAGLEAETETNRESFSSDPTVTDSSWVSESKLSANNWGSVLRGGYEVRLGNNFALTADCLFRWARVSGFTGTRTIRGDGGMGAAVSDDVELSLRQEPGTIVGTASYLEIIPKGETAPFQATVRPGRIEFSGFYFRVGGSLRF